MGTFCWARRRRTRRCWKICCSLCGLVLVVLFFGGYYLYTENVCSEMESQQLIRDLCDLYHQDNITGSLCHSLCDTHKLVFHSCANYRRGKKVLYMTCHDCEADMHRSSTVVLKTKTDLDKREMLQHQFDPQNAGEAELKDFKNMVRFIVTENAFYEIGVKIPSDKDAFSYLWGWDFDSYINSRDVSERNRGVLVALESLYSLTYQVEYVTLRYLQDQSYIPKIYGTCGPAYVVEYTETLSRYDFTLFHSTKWKDRVQSALQLIDVMRHLQIDLHKPLHLCDVKPDNFGLRRNGQVTLIDIDCAMFDDKLLGQFESSNCSSHDDCDFFDCRGFCDTTTHTCLLSRTNDNMQSVCEDIFSGYIPKVPSGLLRDPPAEIKVDMYTALQECAYPGKDPQRHSVRHRASDMAVQKLEYLLKKSLKQL